MNFNTLHQRGKGFDRDRAGAVQLVNVFKTFERQHNYFDGIDSVCIRIKIFKTVSLFNRGCEGVLEYFKIHN